MQPHINVNKEIEEKSDGDREKETNARKPIARSDVTKAELPFTRFLKI